jgi:predicted transcriptional regulator
MKNEVEKRKATFSVPEPILRQLDQLSRATGYNKSVLVSLALEQFIRKEAGRVRK